MSVYNQKYVSTNVTFFIIFFLFISQKKKKERKKEKNYLILYILMAVFEMIIYNCIYIKAKSVISRG